jgi:hypothetical protein
MLALIAIGNDYLRNQIQDHLRDMAVDTMQVPDYPAAEATVQQCPYPTNIYVCDVKSEKDAVEKSRRWRELRGKAKRRGYFVTQRCFVISDDRLQPETRHFLGSDVEFISRRRAADLRKIMQFVDKLRQRPILTFTHVGASAFSSQQCVSGEVISPITLRLTADSPPATLDLFRFTRIVVDATSKYANKFQTQDNRSMISLMAADPLYRWLLEDRSLTIRNYITAWSRFEKQLLQVGATAHYIANSRKIGREAFYFVDAECELIHIENALR